MVCWVRVVCWVRMVCWVRILCLFNCAIVWKKIFVDSFWKYSILISVRVLMIWYNPSSRLKFLLCSGSVYVVPFLRGLNNENIFWKLFSLHVNCYRGKNKVIFNDCALNWRCSCQNQRENCMKWWLPVSPSLNPLQSHRVCLLYTMFTFPKGM